MTPIVSLAGVEKTYGKGETAVHALRNVDLEVCGGEVVLLAGPSGSGKSTLLSIASGVLDADAGHSSVLGVDWASLDVDERARRRSDLIGFVFQQFNLVPTIRVDENVAVPLLIRGVGRREALHTARERLASVGLEARSSDRPGRLSGGMQQRVAIARALTTDPRVLVCDEPTANLDIEAGREVMDLLVESSRRSGGTEERCVIVVTHDPRLFAYADRVVRLEDGRLVEGSSNHAGQERLS